MYDRRCKHRPAKYHQWAANRPEWWNRFHELWTKAVGSVDYDKRQWQEFEAVLFKVTGEKP